LTSPIATIVGLVLLAGALGATTGLALAQDPPPVEVPARPPEPMPPAGPAEPAVPGEPAAPAAPEGITTQEKLGKLAKELSQVANAHGPDAVALQVGLLVRAMQAGAVDATEVRVVGPSPEAGETFLRIELLSGLIFDAKTSTPTGRARTLWRDVAAPAIDGLESYATTPPNLELVIDYGLQDFELLSDRKPDPTERYDHRRMRFEVPEDVVHDCVAGAQAAADALGSSRVFDADRRIEP